MRDTSKLLITLKAELGAMGFDTKSNSIVHKTGGNWKDQL